MYLDTYFSSHLVIYGHTVFMWIYTINDLAPLGESYLIDDTNYAQVNKRFRERVAFNKMLRQYRCSKDKKEECLGN